MGRLRSYEDIYGIDKKMAAALFGKAEVLSTEDTAALAPGPRPQKRSAWNAGLGGALNSVPGLFGINRGSYFAAAISDFVSAARIHAPAR